MTDLVDLTVCAALDGLRRGEFSSRELTDACLELIDRLDGALHAFLTLTPELARQQSEKADTIYTAWRREKNQVLPPLLGVPLALKDVFCLKGVRTTCGSRILDNFIPPYSATSVERLLGSGMVMLGKTNTDEFAMGSSTENSAYGFTRNPWDASRVPGGSSGGSASCVAARLAPAAMGSDTGGSVRQPASFCGICGIKPTYGRVSRYGLVAYGSSLDCPGVFARTVEDVALLFQHMAGYDPRDATSVDLPLPDINLAFGTEHLRGLRVGVPQEYFIEGISPAVETAVREAIAELERLGASVVPIRLPHTSYALPVYYLIAPAEASANLARFDGVRYGPREPGDTLWEMFTQNARGWFWHRVKRRIMLGTYALSAGYYDAYYGQAQKVRTLIKQDFENAFEKVDLIAAPVAPSTAFRFGEHNEDPLAMYLEDVFTLPANLAGVPGLAFPVGFDVLGLPIGIQIMGPHYREDLLFRVGHAYQQATEWHLKKPDFNG